MNVTDQTKSTEGQNGNRALSVRYWVRKWKVIVTFKYCEKQARLPIITVQYIPLSHSSSSSPRSPSNFFTFFIFSFIIILFLFFSNHCQTFQQNNTNNNLYPPLIGNLLQLVREQKHLILITNSACSFISSDGSSLAFRFSFYFFYNFLFSFSWSCVDDFFSLFLSVYFQLCRIWKTFFFQLVSGKIPLIRSVATVWRHRFGFRTRYFLKPRTGLYCESEI